MRRTRIAVAIALIACASAALVVSTAGSPTSASAAPGPPTATTGSASNVAQSSATVNATVNPNGTDTDYYFQYGTTTAYGSNTASTDAGAGTADVAATANLTGLTPSTTYHYRVVAVSTAGPTDGVDQTFTTTTPPGVTTGTPSSVTRSSASVTGTVNPQGQATTYYFRYGTTTAYGLQTSPASAGSETGQVAVHATIAGLTASTIYHYQLVATNAGGTTFGTDQTLTTTSSQLVSLAHEGFESPGGVVGVGVGCLHGTDPCKGHITIAHNGTVLAQRSYTLSADSGGFLHFTLSSAGQKLVAANSTGNLLPVTITATGSTGQKLSFVIHLARWVWH